jgi:hypothetical protein
MTARTRSTPDDRRREADTDSKPSAVGRLGWAATPVRLKLALLVSIAGAAITVVGVRQGLVATMPPPAFGSGPLLLILAIAPAALALGGVLVGQAPTAAGVLAGAALLSPGLALVDAQFLRDALQVARPEVMVPTSLAPLTPSAGVFLLLGGHVAAAVAGLLAIGRAGADPDSDYFAALDASVDPAARRRGVGWALLAGTVSTVGLLLPPFRSDNAFVVAHDLIGSPRLVEFGGLLIAITLLVGGVAAAANPRPAHAKGMAVGLFVALSWLVLPQIVAIASVDWVHVERGGPLIALIPVGLLAVVLFLRSDITADKGEIQLDTSPLHVATGVLGVLTGIAALVGSFGALVIVEGGGDQPDSYANRQLLPAGILIILLGVALFTRWAGAVRPAFVVALGAVVLVGFATADAAFTGAGAGNVIAGLPVARTELRVGAGVWFAIAAIVLGGVAAIVAAVAGGAERDDVDLTKRVLNSRYGIPAGGAALFAIGAFGSPMITAPDFTAPGIWTDFRLASWGLLIGLVVVAAAAAIAALARPARAAALLLGAAVVVGVHLLELPMTGDRAPDAHAGTGTWLSIACLVALLVAAIAALTDPDKHASE